MKIELNTIGKTFSARKTAHGIFDSVDSKTIEVDFNNVESITPSFCHEMFSIFIEKKQTIKILNANENVKLQINKAISLIKQ